jgi:MFS family permease
MRKYFDFYDPLEKRYIFNNFLVIVVLVEILILVFTLIWQMDEGMFGGPVKVIPFPWKEYLVAAFTAPIALVFLFGVIVRGFEMISRQEGSGDQERARLRQRARRRLLWGVVAVVAGLLLLWGAFGLTWITGAVKVLGLGGAYLLIALVALVLLYFPLRLLLRYRLEKKALEYQYLLTVAERYGVVLTEGKKLPPEVVRALEEKKNASSPPASLPGPEELPEKPDSN